MKTLVVLCIFTGAVGTMRAQNPEPPAPRIPVVTPGDGTVDGNRIPAYDNVLQMSVEASDGTERMTGRWEDQVQLVQIEGKAALRRIQHVRYTNGRGESHIDEADRKTLRQFRTSIREEGSPDATTEIRYAGARISGERPFNIGGEGDQYRMKGVFTLEFPKPVFDWHLWGILIAGFPLKEGYAAKFLAYASTSQSDALLRWYSLSVEGREMVPGGRKGPVECWIVRVEAEVSQTIWIAVNKDVAPVQQMRMEGPDGNILWWRPSPG